MANLFSANRNYHCPSANHVPAQRCESSWRGRTPIEAGPVDLPRYQHHYDNIIGELGIPAQPRIHRRTDCFHSLRVSQSSGLGGPTSCTLHLFPSSIRGLGAYDSSNANCRRHAAGECTFKLRLYLRKVWVARDGRDWLWIRNRHSLLARIITYARCDSSPIFHGDKPLFSF